LRFQFRSDFFGDLESGLKWFPIRDLGGPKMGILR